MKTSIFTQTVLWLATVVLTFTSCRSSRSTPQYPEPDSRRYPGEYPREERYPDSRTYPGEYPRDRRVEGMPPGHAKKVYGHKSAKVFAPGQRKKQGGYYGKYPLIINKPSDRAIQRSEDNRYYYKNQDGYYYWQGYDRRFYLDERYVSRDNYDREEYEEWRSMGRNQKNKRGYDYDDDDYDDDRRKDKYKKEKKRKKGKR